MNDEILNSLSEQIIKPDLFNNIKFENESRAAIYPYNHDLSIYIKVNVFQINDNLMSLLKWIKYKTNKFNNTICLYNWDDDKEFDFQTSYNTYLFFKIKNLKEFVKFLPDKSPYYNFIKNIESIIYNKECIDHFNSYFNELINYFLKTEIFN